MTTATLADSGIVFNGTDPDGVYWSLQSESGLWGRSPSPRDVSGDRAVAHGTWSATEFYGPRSWNPSLQVTAPDHDAMHAAEARLSAAVGLAPFEVVGDEPHFGVRYATYRRSGEVLWSEDDPTHARVSLSLIADDPLIRGEVLSASTRAPSSVGGLAWPATWPAVWSAVVTSGQLRLVNEGTMPASIRWRIDGPITDPYVIDLDTGRALRTSLTLGVGEWLTIDTATHRVLANGDPLASRRDRLYGSWFDALPGTTEVQFGGSAAGPAAQLTATWAPTWI